MTVLAKKPFQLFFQYPLILRMLNCGRHVLYRTCYPFLLWTMSDEHRELQTPCNNHKVPWWSLASRCRHLQTFSKESLASVNYCFPKGLSFYILTKQILVQCLLYTVYRVKNILVCTLTEVIDTQGIWERSNEIKFVGLWFSPTQHLFVIITLPL